MSRKTITIKIETWKKLSNLKIEKNLRSLDDAINYLLEKVKK
jgi:predicted CopG family antitoxin